jgi:hypothetical protein
MVLLIRVVLHRLIKARGAGTYFNARLFSWSSLSQCTAVCRVRVLSGTLRLKERHPHTMHEKLEYVVEVYLL